MEHIVKFGTSALVSYPIYGYLYSGKVISAMGNNINLPIALSVASGVSYLAADVLHEYIFPALHVSEKFSSPVSSGVNIAGNYAAQNVLLSVMNTNAPAEIGQTKLLLGAAGSSMASHYIYNSFIAPMYGYTHTTY